MATADLVGRLRAKAEARRTVGDIAPEYVRERDDSTFRLYMEAADCIEQESAANDLIAEERDAAMRGRNEWKVLAEQLQSRVALLQAALRTLAFMARTSCGTAGRDEKLVAACEEAEKLLASP